MNKQKLERNEDERKAFMRVYEKYAGLRLTARGEDGFSYFPECFNEPCVGTGCRKDDCEFIRVVCEKLCRIEDRAFNKNYKSPEEIENEKRIKRELFRCNRSNYMLSRLDVEMTRGYDYFCELRCRDCRKHLMEMIGKGEG